MTRPICIIGSRFTQIIESCPNKLSYTIRQIFMLDKVIFGKIGQEPRLYIIRRRLMIVILLPPLHGVTGNLYTPRELTVEAVSLPKTIWLGKLFIIFLIFMRSIVKSGNIHYCSHIIIDNGIRCIHPLCDRTVGLHDDRFLAGNKTF